METNLSISLELIYLINWLLKHNKQDLDLLVKKAIANGFDQKLTNLNNEKISEMTQDLPITILDFLFYLEDSILNNLKKIESPEKTQLRLIPTLKKIDPQNVDMQTLWITIQQTKSAILKNKSDKSYDKKDDSKKILTENLLKNWNPDKNEILN